MTGSRCGHERPGALSGVREDRGRVVAASVAGVRDAYGDLCSGGVLIAASPDSDGALPPGLYEPLPSPCSDCPFRKANRGTYHPLAFHLATRADALWMGGPYELPDGSRAQDTGRGLRRGAQMPCHKTNPDVADNPGL